MKGSESRLLKFMEGADKRFVIPVYQRNYDWKIENCKQLYDDLVKEIKSGKNSHFFGSIVAAYNPDGYSEEYLIIDGQQRLTTVSLLLLAMHNLIKQGKEIPEDKRLIERIYEDYLVDKYQPEETRIKLKPVKNDRKAFGKLFESEEDYIGSSNLTSNYKYFYDRIQREEITIDQLFQAIRGLEIINIRLDAEDDPQLIFESLNSTGLDLSEGDKIRNLILMGLPVKTQEAFYEKYWNKIEENTVYQIDLFIRDYLSIKQRVTPSFNRIYFTFKQYLENAGIATEELLSDLLDYARLYNILITGKTADKRLASCINRLNRLETTVTRPFFMEVLRLQKDGSLSVDDVVEAFSVTESYIVRRSICELSPNQLNKIFLFLHREIMRYDGTSDNYVEKLKYALLSKRDRARFPDDNEFAEAFGNKQIYSMNAKNKIYILERFENFGTIEDKDVYRHLDDGEYSIEHIMPQHLTPVWAESLGEDYEIIHDKWLHRMANLTLTGYNSKYSNNSFAEKRDMPNGFKDSGIRMNRWISSCNTWGEEELEARNDLVVQQALEIWAFPVTVFKPVEKQLDFFTLDDETDMSGRKIASFRYLTLNKFANSWADMFESIVRLLHDEDNSVLYRLAYETDSAVELASYVSTQKENLRNAVEIDKELFVEGNTSTWAKLSILRRLFALYGKDPSDLVFYLRNDADKGLNGAESEKTGRRKEFWKHVLDSLQEAHKESGAFRDAVPCERHYVNGYVGLGGIHLGATVYANNVRAVLYFGKGKAELNEAAYDKVIQNRQEIEKKMGIDLVWDRRDGKRTCRVYCVLDDSGYNNIDSWDAAARFLAKNTQKLYEYIVKPYLLND